MNRLVLDGETGAALSVPAHTLDAIGYCRVPKLVKIDADGHEAKVIEAASKTFSSLQLQAVITETMKQFGFRTFQNDPFNRKLLVADDGNANTIFARDSQAAGVRGSEFARFQLVNGTI